MSKTARLSVGLLLIIVGCFFAFPRVPPNGTNTSIVSLPMSIAFLSIAIVGFAWILRYGFPNMVYGSSWLSFLHTLPSWKVIGYSVLCTLGIPFLSNGSDGLLAGLTVALVIQGPLLSIFYVVRRLRLKHDSQFVQPKGHNEGTKTQHRQKPPATKKTHSQDARAVETQRFEGVEAERSKIFKELVSKAKSRSETCDSANECKIMRRVEVDNLPVGAYVYVIREMLHGRYKIGKSNNPSRRLREFVKLPFPIELVYLIQCKDMSSTELELHRHYAEKRINGEWFNLDDSDLDALAERYKAIKIE